MKSIFRRQNLMCCASRSVWRKQSSTGGGSSLMCRRSSLICSSLSRSCRALNAMRSSCGVRKAGFGLIFRRWVVLFGGLERKSRKGGSLVSACVSTHGVWLLASAQELFMPYDEFPWFKDAPVRSIINVQEMSPGHFCWPDLDVDLSLESIIHPERFPLKSSATSASTDCLNN